MVTNSSAKTQHPGLLFIGALFLLVVVFYLPGYAEKLMPQINQYTFFVVLINLAVKSPYLALFLFSAVLTLFSTLLMKHFTDQDHLKALKKRQKELQKEIREHQKNKEFTKLEELNKEVIDITMSMMKASFSIKQLVITMVPLLLFFFWLKEIFIEMIGWSFPKFIIIYLLFSIITSTIYRKILKMA